MPIYDYKCNECGGTYDILHKVREDLHDVVCPSCGSTRHTRLISAAAVRTTGSAASRRNPADAQCADGSCCGGACTMN